MTWIAVLLIGFAVADLAHSVRPVPIVNECPGAAVAVWVGLLAGLTDPGDLLALAVIAPVLVGWGQTVTRAFGGGPAWVPLLVLGALAAAGAALLRLGAPRPAGCWATGSTSRVPVLRGLSADRALLLPGVFLCS